VNGLLSIRGVAKRFGQTKVLNAVSLDVAEGEFLTILGESGSGKTTLLRIISGFERPDEGGVWMGGERLDVLPPSRRAVNTVFQSYALFPHLSVFENVAYGLRAKKTAKKEITVRVESALAQVKMRDFAQRKPAQLSGGQQQRVALSRALVNRPRLLLLDEPLSALDANLRRQMQSELKALQREVGIAFIFVTHDQEEAMTLSDRIALLRAGEVEQVSTPPELYNKPRTAYVATFVGQTNLLRARVENGIAVAGPLKWPSIAEGEMLFSLRPEHIRVVDAISPSAPASARFRGRVRKRVFNGPSDLVEVECDGDFMLTVRVPNQGELGGELLLAFDAENVVALGTMAKKPLPDGRGSDNPSAR
jgi:ABC-type Fe3+/spermidine/putrescine transport system ATPase subunit